MTNIKKRRFNHVYFVAIAGNLLALTGDTTLTWSSPVLPKLSSNDSSVNPLGRPITTDEESWIGSLQYIGAMTGILPFTFLADRIGRKPVLLLLALPHIVSFVAFAFATDIGWYYVGRFLGGVSLSSVYVVLPMYVAEISENSYRGMLLVSFSTFASFGDLLPYVIGPYLSIMWFNLVLCLIPIIFLVSFWILAPESPYFYVGKDISKAQLSIVKLRSTNNDNVIANEIDLISKEKQKNRQGDFLNTLKKKYVIKGFVLALVLSVLQQLSGLGPILAYTETIFTDSGSKISPAVSSVVVGLVLFLASFGGPLLVDRQGRKFLLLCSSLGVIVSLTTLGTYFYLQDSSDTDLSGISWLPMASLMVFTVSFNIGYGPLPYTITSEVLPSNVKFYLATVSGFSGWLMSFIVTKYFMDLNEMLGRGGTFWLFSGFCVFGVFFVVFVLPETKGKSFDEIQIILNK